MNKKILILIIFLLFLVSISSSGDNLKDYDFTTGNDGIFTNYNLDSGLSQSSIESVLLDSKGRLWIATQDGLNLFFGDYFKHYKYYSNDDTTISNNTTQNVFEDYVGDIWVGTISGGINKYIDETDNFIIFDDRLINGQHIEVTLRGNIFEIGDTVSIQLISLAAAVYEYYNTFQELINVNPGSAAPANPTSNISNGALGYFSAWSSDIKTVVIEE